MKGMNTIACVFLVAATLNLQVFGTNNNASSCSSSGLSTCLFPPNFVFGTASSAFQYEGANNIDGRGPSIWDTYMHEHPDKIADQSDGSVAIDHYHRYKEDIALMKEMGMDAYRFSISWPRVLPCGRGAVNQKGLAFYNNLINETLAQGMKPFVTIFHWDVPYHLEFEYGGFRDKRIVQDYLEYAELLFKTFGDRVKHWITFNEPSIFSEFGYNLGFHAPGRCSKHIGNCTYGDSGKEPYDVGHNQLLAHAAAVDVYRKKYKASQKGEIGITLASIWMVPYSNSQSDILAQQRALDFDLGWFMDPVTHGDYPKSMKDNVGNRLPTFTPEEQKLLQGSIDFLGLNYYTANYARDVIDKASGPPSYTSDSRVNLTTVKDGIPIGDPTPVRWIYVYPQGLMDLLVHIKNTYRNPVIYITENGMGEANNASLPLEEARKDTQRKEYYCSHLHYLLKAINEKKVDVRGYFAWTFMDNLEWNGGYMSRFGIVYVDYKNNLQRYMKDSAFWFKEFLVSQKCPKRMQDTNNLKEL